MDQAIIAEDGTNRSLAAWNEAEELHCSDKEQSSNTRRTDQNRQGGSNQGGRISLRAESELFSFHLIVTFFPSLTNHHLLILLPLDTFYQSIPKERAFLTPKTRLLDRLLSLSLIVSFETVIDLLPCNVRERIIGPNIRGVPTLRE